MAGIRASFWQFAIVAAGVLVGLKLTGVLGWPWLVVTASLWLPLLVSAGVRLALVGLVVGAVWLIEPGGVATEVEALALEVASWFSG